MLLTAGFVGLGQWASAQAAANREVHTTKLKGGGELVEVLPEFIAGRERFHSILSESLVYPPLALKEKIGGKVLVQFTVDSLGDLVNVKIKEGVRDDIDSEAV